MKTYADYVTMLGCTVAAFRRKLSENQIDWLCADRERAEYFSAVMEC